MQKWRTDWLVVAPINLDTMGEIVVVSVARRWLVKLHLADTFLLCHVVGNDLIALCGIEQLGGKNGILRSITGVEDRS